MNPLRRTLVSLLVLGVLSSFVACSESPRWTGSVGVQDGLEVVSNPGDPLLAGTDGLVSELWKVQGPDWVDPSGIHARAGLVALVDMPANQIHVVSASGEILSSLGRPGGGPGEFLHLVDAFSDGGRMVALDGGKGSVEYLDLEGNYLSSERLDGQPWSGFSLGEGTLLVKGEFLSDPTAETLGDWVRVGKGRKPVAFTAQPLDPLPEEDGVRCSDLSSWGEGAARFRFTTPQIQVFDPSGELIRKASVDLAVEPVTEAERETALSELEHGLATRGMPAPFIEQSLVVQEQRWRVKCRFGPLRFDATRHFAAFLEQNPDDFGSGNATLHFLSEDGVYLARVVFSTPWEDFAMDDGVAYALTRDPITDLNTLRAFRLDLPASLFTEAGRVLEEARQRAATDR